MAVCSGRCAGRLWARASGGLVLGTAAYLVLLIAWGKHCSRWMITTRTVWCWLSADAGRCCTVLPVLRLGFSRAREG